MYVQDLDLFVDLFVTAQILEETPALLSLGQLCEDHGYSDEWTSGEKPHLILKMEEIQCKTESYVPIGVPRIINETCKLDHEYLYNIVTAGLNISRFNIESSIYTKSEYTQSSTSHLLHDSTETQK